MINRGPQNKNSKRQSLNLDLFLSVYGHLVMVMILIVFLAASYFLILRPKFSEAKLAIQNNIDQQQKLFDDQQTKLSNLQAVASLYKKIKPADLQKFNGVLPDEYVKEKLFGEIEELITKQGLIVNTISVTKEGGAGATGAKPANASPVPDNTRQDLASLGRINIDLSIEMINYSAFKNLLRVLENNLRLFDISAVSFAPDSETAAITLTTYYYQKIK